MRLLIAFLVLVFVAALPAAASTAFPPVKFVTVSSPVSRGGTASVTIQTLVGTPCVITVFYRSGPSRSSGLFPKTAGRRGRITWTWKVGTRTTPGRWPIRVECGSDEITRVETEFTVI